MVAPYAPPQQGYGAPPGGPGPIIDAEFRDLVSAARQQIGPPKPPWLSTQARPNAERIKEQANAMRVEHKLRLAAGTLMELRAGMELSSVFLRDLDWAQAGEIEPFRSALISRATADIAGFVESMNVVLRSPARGLHSRDEASAKDDALHELLADWEESHYRAGLGSLKRTRALDAINHGMTATYLAPDPGNQRTGARIRAVDPKVVFPMFSSRGLERVYCLYEAGPDEMEANFGDGGPTSAHIRRIGRDKGDSVDYAACHEVIEFHNRQWSLLFWKGEIIRRWEHRLWRCPWVIGLPNWRYARNTSTAGVLADNGFPTGMLDQNGREITGSARQRDLARRFEPFLTAALPLNEVMEQIGSHLVTGVRDARDAPLYWQKSTMRGIDEPPLVNNFAGGVTEDEEGSKLDLLPTAPVADHFDPLMQLITTNMQAIFPLPFLQGQGIGTQSSGQAVDIMNETGYAKWSGVPAFMQLDYQAIGHDYLSTQKEWSDTMGAPGQRGGLAVPARTPDRYGVYPSHTLNKAMLERSGCYTTCKMSRFSLQGMTAAAATAQILHTTMGIVADEEIIELLGFSDNPRRTVEMRRFQNLENSPEYIKAFVLVWLKREVQKALMMGDEEDAWELGTIVKRLSSMQTLQDQQLAAMAGGQQDPMEVLQGMDPGLIQQFLAEQGGAGQGGPGAPGATATGLQSPSDIANDVGHMGGRLALPQEVGVG